MSGVYGSRRWRRVRAAVLRRDGFRCRVCGHGGRLEVHHVNPLWRSAGDPFDADGLETLCRACHFERHGKRAKPDPRGRAAWKRELSGS